MNTTNPTFYLKVVDLTDPLMKIKTLHITSGHSSEYVLNDVIWANINQVTAVVANRVQDSAEIMRCDIRVLECSKVIKFLTI